jgi:hypothetical protein
MAQKGCGGTVCGASVDVLTEGRKYYIQNQPVWMERTRWELAEKGCGGAVCGASVDVLTVVDLGNNQGCKHTLKTAKGTTTGVCTPLFFPECSGYAGSIELIAVDVLGVSANQYQGPKFQTYLDAIGVGEIAFLGGEALSVVFTFPCLLVGWAKGEALNVVSMLVGWTGGEALIVVYTFPCFLEG